MTPPRSPARTASLPTTFLNVAVLNVAGLALLVAGWAAVSGRLTLSAQAPYLNLAVAGILLAGVGNALYIMALRRSLEERLARVHDRIDHSLVSEIHGLDTGVNGP